MDKTSEGQPEKQNKDQSPSSLESDQDSNGTPDEDAPIPISEDLPISPMEDAKSYGDLIRKIASYLGLSCSEPKSQVEDVIFDVVQRDVSPPVVLPMTSVLLQAIHISWEHPTLAPTSTKRLDHMYKIQESTAKFLYIHPKPSSLVFSSSAKGQIHRHQSYPPDKDGKRMDIFECRIYSSTSLVIKGCNYLACMARYIYGLMDDLSSVIPTLPEEPRQKLLCTQVNGLVAAKQQISITKHILESSSRSLSSVVTMRRFAWLRSSNLPQDTKELIEDMAFNKSGLCNKDIDATTLGR